VSVKALNDHAAQIQPELFEWFGPHAAEKAVKVKQALMSANPTAAMSKLWHEHKDLTGDLKWTKRNKAA
jgi:hypothetical protein